MEFCAALRPVRTGKAVQQGRGRPRERGAEPAGSRARGEQSGAGGLSCPGLGRHRGPCFPCTRSWFLDERSVCADHVGTVLAAVTGRPVNLRNPEQFRFLPSPESALGGSAIAFGLCGPDCVSLCQPFGFLSWLLVSWVHLVQWRLPALPPARCPSASPSAAADSEPACWGRLPALPCAFVISQPASPASGASPATRGSCGALGTARHGVTVEAFAAILAASAARMTV